VKNCVGSLAKEPDKPGCEDKIRARSTVFTQVNKTPEGRNMTQVALAALRSVENPNFLVRAARDGLALADRVTLTGHITVSVVIGVTPCLARYAYDHPATGLVASALLLTGTVRRALHRLAGASLRPRD
jgi:hypothetical protein